MTNAGSPFLNEIVEILKPLNMYTVGPILSLEVSELLDTYRCTRKTPFLLLSLCCANPVIPDHWHTHLCIPYTIDTTTGDRSYDCSPVLSLEYFRGTVTRAGSSRVIVVNNLVISALVLETVSKCSATAYWQVIRTYNPQGEMLSALLDFDHP